MAPFAEYEPCSVRFIRIMKIGPYTVIYTNKCATNVTIVWKTFPQIWTHTFQNVEHFPDFLCHFSTGKKKKSFFKHTNINILLRLDFEVFLFFFFFFSDCQERICREAHDVVNTVYHRRGEISICSR